MLVMLVMLEKVREIQNSKLFFRKFFDVFANF